MPQNLLYQLPQLWCARQIGAVARQIHAGQHDLGVAALDQGADLVDHSAHRHRTRIAAAIGNDAEGTAMVAAVLHLHEHPWQAALKTFQEMRRHPGDRHDVGDRDLLSCLDTKSGIERGAGVVPGLAPHLLVIADDAVDFRHIRKHPGLRLRRAAGDDNARIGPLALQPPDRLPRLRHRLVGDGAAVDDDGVGKSGEFRLAGDHLGFEGVETAAEGEDVDAHFSQATLANSAGSKRPSYSKSAVPVISTWSSCSRHSIASLPPGSVISTWRLARFSRAAATAVAQAAEPQARVNPAPRSQVRIVM